MLVEGKAAVVTGASSGVGRATALALAQRGCAVLVNYRNSQAEAEQVVAAAIALGAPAFAFQADVADDAQCQTMVAAAAQEFGRLDILINNAGATRFVP